MKSKSVLFCSAFFLLTTACSQISSNQVEPSAIYGSISIDREGNTVNVSDTFYVGGATGTVVTLDSPAGVTINGTPASSSTDIVNMTSYDGSVSSASPDIDVNYTDKSGASYDNIFAVPGDIWNTGVPGSISLSSGFTLTVNTHNGFLPGESINVNLMTTGGSSFQNVNVSVGATTQTIFVPGNSYPYFTPGTGTLVTCRTKIGSAQAPYPSGTEVTIQSCTTSSPITVTY